MPRHLQLAIRNDEEYVLQSQFSFFFSDFFLQTWQAPWRCCHFPGWCRPPHRSRTPSLKDGQGRKERQPGSIELAFRPCIYCFHFAVLWCIISLIFRAFFLSTFEPSVSSNGPRTPGAFIHVFFILRDMFELELSRCPCHNSSSAERRFL